ncbi:hypothetical protein C7E18_23630, partial [Stenotrophomonas maltophilia]
ALAHRDQGGVFFIEVASALGLRERYGYAAFERLPTRHHVLQQLNTALAHRDQGGVFFIEVASALGLRERYGYAAFERL